MTAECKYQEIENQEVMPNYKVNVSYCKLKQYNPSVLACEFCQQKTPDHFEKSEGENTHNISEKKIEHD